MLSTPYQRVTALALSLSSLSPAAYGSQPEQGELSRSSIVETSNQALRQEFLLDTISQVGSHFGLAVRAKVHGSGETPSKHELAEGYVQTLLTVSNDFQTWDACLQEVVEKWWDLDLAREVARSWSERFPRQASWAEAFLSGNPAGDFLVSAGGSMFYGPLSTSEEFILDSTVVFRVHAELSGEDAVAAESKDEFEKVLQTWAVIGLTLERLEDDGEPIQGKVKETIVEIFVRPPEQASQAISSSWLGEAINELAEPGRISEYRLTMRGRFTSMTATPDGNRENGTFFRDRSFRFTYDPSMKTRAERLEDGSLKIRLTKLTSPDDELSPLATVIRDQIADIEGNLAFWKRENTFLATVGRIFPIEARLVEKVLVPHESGEGREVSLQPATALDLRQGDLAVVHLFAMWCGPCLAGMPELDKLAEAVGAEQTKVISLCFNDSERDSVGYEDFVTKKAYKHLFALAKSDLSEHINTPVVPSYLVIDHTGKVLFATTPTHDGVELSLIEQFVLQHRAKQRSQRAD